LAFIIRIYHDAQSYECQIYTTGILVSQISWAPSDGGAVSGGISLGFECIFVTIEGFLQNIRTKHCGTISGIPFVLLWMGEKWL